MHDKFPVGHPVVYIDEECKQVIGDDNDISKVEGLIKCTVLPPRNLYHPVLPVRMYGKLMFALCRSCCDALNQNLCIHENSEDRTFTGTWVSVELQKAVGMGYIITKIEEIWQYEVSQYDPSTRIGGLFVDYIDTFLKVKQESSGWLIACIDEESKQKYLDDYKKAEGITLERERVAKNSELRAKLCLNSFWGKFGQRENQPKTTIVTDGKTFLETVSDPKKEILSVLPVSDDVVYINWCNVDDTIEPSRITNVVIAAYTTAQARLRLYALLEKIGRQCLYYDTDSIIFIRSDTPDSKDLQTGTNLGDLTDELEDYGEGSYISEFASCGRKCYAYKVETPKGVTDYICKVEGISLNYANTKSINFDTLKSFATTGISPEGDEEVVLSYKSLRRTPMHDVITRNETKTFKNNFVKRRLVDNYDSVPYVKKSCNQDDLTIMRQQLDNPQVITIYDDEAVVKTEPASPPLPLYPESDMLLMSPEVEEALENLLNIEEA
ncbi:uncharacterized protein LOC107270419, partial [Cephus cinctus]|uniref:Uncharacterized protein LOC107270419 n=1 Tax=Cephus cinctus TaxID=211228 RepID=A0AAJ7C399_CEPCN